MRFDNFTPKQSLNLGHSSGYTLRSCHWLSPWWLFNHGRTSHSMVQDWKEQKDCHEDQKSNFCNEKVHSQNDGCIMSTRFIFISWLSIRPVCSVSVFSHAKLLLSLDLFDLDVAFASSQQRRYGSCSILMHFVAVPRKQGKPAHRIFSYCHSCRHTTV